MKFFDYLIGTHMVNVQNIHDFLKVNFEDGTILIVRNKCYFVGKISDFIEEKLVKVDDNGDRIVFTFESGKEFAIGMNENDYNGPESFEVIKKGDPTLYVDN